MQTKVCKCCNEDKPLSSFAIQPKGKFGVTSKCKQCKNESRRAKRLSSLEEYRAKERATYLANKEAIHAYNRERRKKFPEVYKAQDAVRRERSRDIIRLRIRSWKQQNRAKVLVDTRRRQARKLNATPRWADREFERFTIAELYDLAKIRSEVTKNSWHVDHIVPLQSDIVCGLHCSANLQVITATENQSKGNRWWPDMPERE